MLVSPIVALIFLIAGIYFGVNQDEWGYISLFASLVIIYSLHSSLGEAKALASLGYEKSDFMKRLGVSTVVLFGVCLYYVTNDYQTWVPFLFLYAASEASLKRNNEIMESVMNRAREKHGL